MRAFFFGNWHYGLYAVALGIEAALQQRSAILGPLYHLIIFFGTVAFYDHAYRGLRADAGSNERAMWSVRHDRIQHAGQLVPMVLLLCCLLLALRLWPFDPGKATWDKFGLLIIFPLVALAYNGQGRSGLRRIGWLKPFVVGFVWAGVVTVYPIVVATMFDVEGKPDFRIGLCLFLGNMLFCTLIAVLFDIKDHADDHRDDLQTFIVRRGLRTTLFSFLLPLTLIGLLTLLICGTANGSSAFRLTMNAVPFLALAWVIFALRKRRSLLYYLMVVDGLLLVKALCGSLSVLLT